MERDGINRTGARYAVSLIGAQVLLTACAAGPNELAGTDPDAAGFWWGFWQGLISRSRLWCPWFNPDVNIYEVNNNGNWYNFGFILGVASAFSSGGRASGAAPRMRRKHQQIGTGSENQVRAV